MDESGSITQRNYEKEKKFVRLVSLSVLAGFTVQCILLGCIVVYQTKVNKTNYPP